MSISKNVTYPGDCQETGKRLLLNILLLCFVRNGHMLTHRNKKPYECKAEGCGKSYCDARSLRRHTENHHQPPPDHSKFTIININIHTYHSLFIPEGIAEASRIILRDAHVLPKWLSYEAADVKGGKPIAIWLQYISGGDTVNPLVAFYDIHGRKREVLFFCSVPDTTRDMLSLTRHLFLFTYYLELLLYLIKRAMCSK
jgi:hypothetical protein